MDDGTARQLALIDEVSSILSTAQIPHWLFGGWAVDFLAGSVRRPHDDVEFFIWEHDGPRAREVVAAAGYLLVDHPHPEEALIWRKDEQVVELYFITVNDRGEIVGRGRWDNWPVPPGSLPAGTRLLEGVECPVVSVDCILNTKVEYEEYTGRPPRDKDRADIVVLRRLLGTAEDAAGGG